MSNTQDAKRLIRIARKLDSDEMRIASKEEGLRGRIFRRELDRREANPMKDPERLRRIAALADLDAIFQD